MKYKVIGISLAMSFCRPAMVSADVVATIPAFSASYPAGKIGGSSATGLPASYIKIPPGDEYYLDYEVSFEPGWQWVRGGKLPGLVGGTHTSGCNGIVPDGWSARFMWRAGGLGQVYLYHQDRKSGCGDEYDFPGPGNFSLGRTNRITEHVVINTPGQRDGVVEAWLDGVKKVSLTNIQLRGKVAAGVARIDNVSLQTFYGGSTLAWAPSQTTRSSFKGFVVRTDLPDFSKPFSVNQPGSAIPSRSWARNGASVGNLTLTYLGGGRMPEIPAGRPGQGISLFDLHGRFICDLRWNGIGLQWEGWTREAAPAKACVLIAKARGKNQGPPLGR